MIKTLRHQIDQTYKIRDSLRLECSDRSNLVKMSDEEMDFGDTNDNDDAGGEAGQPSPSVLEEGEEEEETQPTQVCMYVLNSVCR